MVNNNVQWLIAVNNWPLSLRSSELCSSPGWAYFQFLADVFADLGDASSKLWQVLQEVPYPATEKEKTTKWWTKVLVNQLINNTWLKWLQEHTWHTCHEMRPSQNNNNDTHLFHSLVRSPKHLLIQCPLIYISFLWHSILLWLHDSITLSIAQYVVPFWKHSLRYSWRQLSCQASP